MSTHQQKAENDDGNLVDAVLAAHDGNVRAAIAGLLDDIGYLRNQIAYASLATSRGYTYGWIPSYQREAQK